jgi:hypothetical protein
MFDQLFYVTEDTDETRGLLAAVSAASRAENQAAAQRLTVIGQLWTVRLAECGGREHWAVDAESAVALEIAAALRISQVAGGQLPALRPVNASAA